MGGSHFPLGGSRHQGSRLSASQAASNDGPAILWVRVGNMSNRKLIELALRALPAIIDAIERDEVVIELVGC
jgi:predicted nuclease of predicted toxin-antitoxin system